MAPNVSLYFYPANDLNGDPLHVITDEDEYFKSLTLKLDLYGLGGAELVLARKVGFAGFGTGTFGSEVFVRVLVHAYSDTEFFTGFFLEKRNQVVISKDEDGGEEFHFGGPGPKAYLARSAIRTETFTGVDWHVDLEDGVWRWMETATWTGVMRRLILEDQASDDPALPDLTFDFDFDDDSASADPSEVGAEFDLPIGQDYLACLWDLEDIGGASTVGLGTVSAPAFVLHLWEEYGSDVSSSTFASGKALLKEGVNITEDSLELNGVALRKCTHVIVEGKDNVWVEVVKPSWDAGEYVKIGHITYTRTANTTVLGRVGLRWLRRQDNGDQELTVEFLPGHTDTDGLYFPNDGPLALGNIISVDTTADGTTHTPIDIQPSEDQLVTGFEMALLPASRTDTALQADRSWSCKVKLNSERAGNAQSPNQTSAATTPPPVHPKCCVHFPPICEEQPPDSESILTDCYDPTNGIDWPGTDVTTGTCWGGDHHRQTGASSSMTGQVTVAPGDVIQGRLNFREETGNDPWENVSNYNYKAWLRFEGPGMPAVDTLIVNQRYHNTGCINVTHTATATVPTGYNKARIVFNARLGGYRYCGQIVEITVADEVVNDPYCVINAGESPYAVRSDDPRLHSTHTAAGTLIDDAGDYYTGTDVEAALQEIGSDLAGLGGGSAHTIKEDGTPLTARAGLNFGSGIVASDDAGNNETDIDLDWAEDADVSTQAFGDAAATGTSQEVARAGHKHGMPADPVTAHVAAGDPHTQYATNTEFDDHSARHESGGADAVKLDDLATPDDNTDLNATTGHHGLLRKLDGATNTYLRGDGAWATPAGGAGGAGTELTYNEFTSNATITATTEATANTVVTASAVAFDGSTVVMIEFYAFSIRPDTGAAGRNISLYLYDGSSSIGRIGLFSAPSGGNDNKAVFVTRRLTPSNATHTYSIRAAISAGTSGLISAGAGGSGADMPGYVRIVSVV